MKNDALSDILPLWHFDDNLLVFADGLLGAGFEVSGKDIGCASKESINFFNNSLREVLSTLTEGISLQIFYDLGQEVLPLIEEHERMSSNPCKKYRKIADAQSKFLRDNAAVGEYFSPRIFIFVKETLGGGLKRQGIFQSAKRFEQITCEEYSRRKEQFFRIVEQLRGLLEGIGLKPVRLEKGEWFSLLYKYFNLSRFEKLGAAKHTKEGTFVSPLASQLAMTDLSVGRDALKIGDYYFKAVTLKSLPESITYASMGILLLKLPFPFWLSQNISILEQKRELEKLQIGRRLANSFASGENLSDLEVESRLDDTETLLRELMSSSEKIVSCGLTLIVWDEDEGVAMEKADDALNAFRAMGRAEGVVETYPMLEAYLKAFPGSADGLRSYKMKSGNAAHLMPLYDCQRGNKRPVCLFPNRDGVLFSIDPFAPELPNWNGLVFGGSGAGKSFSVCQLMLQFYGQIPVPKIVWIDNGESSRGLVEYLEGSFIDLGLDTQAVINMFDLPEGEKEPSSSKVKLILAVLESILKEEGKERLAKRERALLEEAVSKTYEEAKGKTPTLSDLKRVLKNHDEAAINGLAPILYPWTGKTAYGQILDGQSNVKLDKGLTTIETRGLDGHPDLQNVLLLIFTDFIRNEAARNLKTPYLLIIDEAWRLFDTPSGAAFTNEAYRTFRKFNGGIWSISQNYRDFLAKEEIKNALLPNTSNIFVLPQKNIDWGDFQSGLDLNEEEVEVIKSLEIRKGEYGEFFLIQGDCRTVVCVTPNPLSYKICTGKKVGRFSVYRTQPSL